VEIKTQEGRRREKLPRAYTYSEKGLGVKVKGFIVRYKCPALRRLKRRGLYNDMGSEELLAIEYSNVGAS